MKDTIKKSKMELIEHSLFINLATEEQITLSGGNLGLALPSNTTVPSPSKPILDLNQIIATDGDGINVRLGDLFLFLERQGLGLRRS